MKLNEAASILVQKHILNNSHYAKLFLKGLKNGFHVPLTVCDGALYKINDDNYELTHGTFNKQ